MVRLMRKDWIDYAKAIGIFLVVFGHWGGVTGNIANFIYAFHMPLFFFLSGLVHKQRNNFVADRTKKILVRYVIYSMVFSITYQIIEGKSILWKSEIISLFIGYYTGDNPSTTLWFLLTLWMTGVFVYSICFIKTRKIQIAIIIILGIAGFTLSQFHIQLPLRIQTAFCSGMFYYIGYQVKDDFDKNQLSRNQNIVIAGIAVLILACITMLNGRIDMGSDLYSNQLLFVIGAVSGITLISILSLNIPANICILQTVGKHSLVIYLLHIYPVMMLNLLFAHAGIEANILTKLISHLSACFIIAVVIFIKEKYLSTKEKICIKK